MQTVVSIRTKEALQELLTDNLDDVKVVISTKALQILNSDFIKNRLQNMIKDLIKRKSINR